MVSAKTEKEVERQKGLFSVADKLRKNALNEVAFLR